MPHWHFERHYMPTRGATQFLLEVAGSSAIEAR